MEKIELSTEEKEQIILTGKSRLKNEMDIDRHNRIVANYINEFQYIKGSQWDEKELKKRELRNRPTLEINKTQKYTAKVTGEMRENKTKIKVITASGEASKEIANVQQGMVCDIENSSSAEAIYDEMGQGIVDCGYGACRVITEYDDYNPFQQNLKIIGIDDPVSTVYMDSHGIKRFYEDANYGFILKKMSKDEFKRVFNKTDEEIPGSASPMVDDIGIWYDEESVTITEYFYKEYKTEHLALLSNGKTKAYNLAIEEIEKIKEMYQNAKIEKPGEFIDDSHIPYIVNHREVQTPIIKWVKMTCDDILKTTTWPGTIIPVVLIHGKTKTIKGVKYFYGLLNNVEDAQKAFNYWYTSVIESVALSPNAPLAVTPEQIKNFENDYLKLHEENMAFIQFNPDPNNPGIPQRLMPSSPSNAAFAELDRAETNIQDTVGMHEADIGAYGREISGNAIEARQRPGHVSNFIYHDNRQKGIAQVGRILVDALPNVYDTERDAKIISDDKTEDYVPINTTIGKAVQLIQKEPEKFSGINPETLSKKVEELGPEKTYNNMKEGKYSIVITAGPSYETKRQESAANLLKFIQLSTTATPLDKYFYLINSDFEGADEYAEAIRKQIPYGTLKPKVGEKPPPPPQPNPVQMAELEIKKLDRQVQEAKQINEAERFKTERIKQQKEILKIEQQAEESGVKIQAEFAKTINEIQKTNNEGNNTNV